VLAWLSLERSADLHMAHMMPLPLTVSCFSIIQIFFAFLIPAHLGSPGQRAVKRVCVCVCVTELVFVMLLYAEHLLRQWHIAVDVLIFIVFVQAPVYRVFQKTLPVVFVRLTAVAFFVVIFKNFCWPNTASSSYQI